MPNPPSPQRRVTCGVCLTAAPEPGNASRDRRLSWGWSTWQINDRGHATSIYLCPRHTGLLRTELAAMAGRLRDGLADSPRGMRAP